MFSNIFGNLRQMEKDESEFSFYCTPKEIIFSTLMHFFIIKNIFAINKIKLLMISETKLYYIE